MTRSVSFALKTRARQPVTAPGYLVRWNMTPAMLWSNIGARVFGGETFAAFDFTIEGLAFDVDSSPSPTIRAQNLDSTMAAVFLNANMGDVTVDVWAFDRDIPGFLDRAKLFRLAVDGAEIGLASVDVRLVQVGLHSPRRRIAPAFGFNYALPAGTQIAWEQEIYITEPASNG